MKYRIIGSDESLCDKCIYWPDTCGSIDPELSDDGKLTLACVKFKYEGSLPLNVKALPDINFNGIACTPKFPEENSITIKTNGKEFRINAENGELSITKTSWSKRDPGNLTIHPSSNNKVIIK